MKQCPQEKAINQGYRFKYPIVKFTFCFSSDTKESN
ncbi:MAG: hypothetical protein K0R59_1946 [Sphingobacterium sp.]|jgi:hypothetical protein|nr:hypothetical protein [Sphingobacterium sp.]